MWHLLKKIISIIIDFQREEGRGRKRTVRLFQNIVLNWSDLFGSFFYIQIEALWKNRKKIQSVKRGRSLGDNGCQQVPKSLTFDPSRTGNLNRASLWHCAIQCPPHSSNHAPGFKRKITPTMYAFLGFRVALLPIFTVCTFGQEMDVVHKATDQWM